MPMPDREQILAALWALERQLPQLLGVEAAQQLQMQLDPLARSLSRGQSDGTALIQLITQYPILREPWQAALAAAATELAQAEMLADLEALLEEPEAQTTPPPDSDDFADLDALLMPQDLRGDTKGYQGLAGAPGGYEPPPGKLDGADDSKDPKPGFWGQRYVCPEVGCTEKWFRIGLRQPPLCKVHGTPLVPAPEPAGDGD
jgi:hypothetical protein